MVLRYHCDFKLQGRHWILLQSEHLWFSATIVTVHPSVCRALRQSEYLWFSATIATFASLGMRAQCSTVGASMVLRYHCDVVLALRDDAVSEVGVFMVLRYHCDPNMVSTWLTRMSEHLWFSATIVTSGQAPDSPADHGRSIYGSPLPL